MKRRLPPLRWRNCRPRYPAIHPAARRHEIPMHPLELHIGDESLWWGDGVAVRRGTRSFGVSVVVTPADRAQRRVWEEALAKQILARLPADGGKTR